MLALVGIVLAPHVVPGSLVNLQNQLDYRYAGANLSLPRATVTNAGGLLGTVISRSFDLLVSRSRGRPGTPRRRPPSRARSCGTCFWRRRSGWRSMGCSLAGIAARDCVRGQKRRIYSRFCPCIGAGAGKEGLAGVRGWTDSALAPAVILFLCETVGFALTLVDTGEGFRHRVNLVLLLSVPLGVMLSRWWETRRATVRTLDLAAAA